MYKVFINDVPLFIHNGSGFKFQNIKDVKELTPDEMTPEMLYDKARAESSIGMGFRSDDLASFWKQWKDQFENIDAAGGLIVRGDGSFLAMYRLGKWDLPKGKADPGETPEITALREVEEECGISGLKIHHPLIETYHVYPLKNRFVLKRTAWFLMQWDGSGDLVPETEEGIEELRWIHPHERPFFYKHTYRSVKEVVENHFDSGA